MGAMFSLASCSDWDDHYDASQIKGTADQTTWEVLQQNPDYSDFCEILQKARVFRQHKVTPATYAEMLQGGLSYTVFAPKNGSFDKDSLLKVLDTAKGDSAVEKKFVLNHISRDIKSFNGQTQKFFLANGKTMYLEGNQVGRNGVKSVAVSNPNVVTKNGVIHFMEKEMPFAANLYEYLLDTEECSHAGAALRKYTQDKFHPEQSLSNGMKDGDIVYADSVISEYNKFFDNVGILNNEDSTYYVTVPKNDAWDKEWEAASKRFYYDPTVVKADSMQHYWTLRALLDDAIYSPSVQSSPNDSLVNWKAYSRRYPGDGHSFKNPFAEKGIMGPENNMTQCTNGKINCSDEWTLTPEKTYLRVIRAEGENFGDLNYNYDSKNPSKTGFMPTQEYSWDKTVVKDMSGNGYLNIEPYAQTGSKLEWNYIMRVRNTLAGPYDISVVLQPLNVKDPGLITYPTKFMARIYSVDKDGNEKEVYDCKSEDGKKYFLSKEEKTDTICLVKGFNFESCNYDLRNDKVRIEIYVSLSKNDQKKYTGIMNLDCVLLRPTETAIKEEN